MAEIYEFARKTRFSPEPFDEITPLAQPWRVKGVLPARGVAFLVGQSKAGKTFVALDAALGLAAGEKKIFGRKARRCGAAYVAAEDANGCRARVAAWRRKHRRNAAPTPFELIGQAVDLLDAADMADLRATLAEADERLTAQGSPLGVVVIDTLSRCIPGVDENSAADMSTAFAALTALSEALGVLVLVVAHFGKSGAERGIRGWSGLDANSDATLTVERDGEDRSLRTLTFAKVKNGQDGGTLSFRLEDVDLGLLDEDGEALSSCVVAYEDAPVERKPEARKRTLSRTEALVLAAIKHVTDHGRTHPLPADVEGAKAWFKAVTRTDVRLRATAAGLAEGANPAAAKMRFSRALEGLSADHRIRVEGELLWLV